MSGYGDAEFQARAAGIMGETFAAYAAQLTIPSSGKRSGKNGQANILRRTNDALPGFEPAHYVDERTTQASA